MMGCLAGVMLLAPLIGCESTVDVDVPEHEPRLVVHSFFAADSQWVVDVSRSVGAFERGDLDDPEFEIENATVTVEAPGQAAVPLTYTDTLSLSPIDGGGQLPGGAYTSPMTRPVSGRRYTLRVDAPGYAAVEARSEAPTPVPLSVASTARRAPLPPGGDGLAFIRQERTVTLTIQDPPGEANYYWIRAQRVETSDGGRREQSTVYFTTRDRSILNDAASDLDDSGEYEGSAAYFADALFDGRTHDIDLTFDEYFFVPDDPDYPEERQHILLEVAVLSSDLYEYLVSSRIFGQNNDNPFAEPINLHTNVTSGYGLFAGRTLQVFTIRSEPVDAE
jgi:hypothetical protein